MDSMISSRQDRSFWAQCAQFAPFRLVFNPVSLVPERACKDRTIFPAVSLFLLFSYLVPALIWAKTHDDIDAAMALQLYAMLSSALLLWTLVYVIARHLQLTRQRNIALVPRVVLYGLVIYALRLYVFYLVFWLLSLTTGTALSMLAFFAKPLFKIIAFVWLTHRCHNLVSTLVMLAYEKQYALYLAGEGKVEETLLIEEGVKEREQQAVQIEVKKEKGFIRWCLRMYGKFMMIGALFVVGLVLFPLSGPY
uniref:hypothetical protein n=1 Tax=Thaumasiovibrio occultus TaxID=1891184 RepID=UPI000B34C679|nr:hypothetical protein [Thaumasiovibrio occultus]